MILRRYNGNILNSLGLHITRGVVLGGAQGCHVGRSVNPISTRRGPDYAHLITTGTPGFSYFPTALRGITYTKDGRFDILRYTIYIAQFTYVTPQRNNNLYEVVLAFFSNKFLRDIFKVFDVPKAFTKSKSFKEYLILFS